MKKMATGWSEIYRSIVLPKHCDHYGHMNVRFYAQHFDDGGFQLWQLIGVKQSDLNKNGKGTVVANINIDFIHELKAGQLMIIKGGWIQVGKKSMTHEQRMFETDSGKLCAIQTTVEVSFDTRKRKPAPLPINIRKKLEANLLSPCDLKR